MPQRRYRILLEYDGTEFAGWQRQPARRSIQGCLEAALEKVTGRPTKVVGSGRTDAGVHAIGQVAHFDSSWQHADEALLRALNAVLPRDIAGLGLDRAASDFHARFDAIARSYEYTLWLRPVRSPLERRRSVQVAQELDLARMAVAARRFEGEHDFVAFGRPMRPEGSTLRRVFWSRMVSEGPRAHYQVRANAFLRHQVRRMVGALIDVGRGAIEAEAISSALAGNPEAIKSRKVPPQGLVLVAVSYPPAEV